MSGRVRREWVHAPVRGAVATLATLLMLACGGDLLPTAAPIVRTISGPVSIALSPAELPLAVGTGGRLSALVLDANRKVVSMPIVWSSEDVAIATVNASDGSVTAVAAGTTTVTARAGDLSATAIVSVRPRDPLVRLSLSPSDLSLFVGGLERLTAQGFDSAGRTFTVTDVVWSTSDPRVVTVDAQGVVAAISLGTTTITAVAGTVHAVAVISVIPSPNFSFAFTRTTARTDGGFQSDVLSFSIGEKMARPLPRAAQFTSIAAPAWSPDGALLAVEVVHGFEQGCPWMDYSSDLYVMSAAAPEGTPWRAVTINGFSKAPSWSPDGKRIAFTQQSTMFSKAAIFVVDAAGGMPTRVTADGWYSNPRWSPDGSRLAFSVWEGDAFVNSEVYVVNVDGSGLTNVTESAAYDADPSWSPDGTRLVFVSDRDRSGYDTGVFVVGADGHDARPLGARIAYSGAPAWSPDGGHILFTSGGSVHVMTAAGSSIVRLTTPPLHSWDTAPAWGR